MKGIYSIILLFIVIFLLILLKKAKTKKIINILFWAIMSILLTALIDTIFIQKFTNIQAGLISSFIVSFFTAAIPEEISKYIVIKISSKKEKNSILINSILISITFACIENFMYTSYYGHYIETLRLLQPGHLFFQLIMALFLIKALNSNGVKKSLFNTLAIIIPVFCHTAFNTFNSINIVSYIFCAIGVLTYILTFYLILKLPIDNETSKIKLIGIKTIVILLSILLLMGIYSENNSSNLNEIQKIKEDNIELKVISSEKITINEGISEGDYIKVKIELKNNNDTLYTINASCFKITDNLSQNNSILSIYSFDDSLNEIEPGKKEIGYLYFNDDGYNYTYLIYSAGEFPDRTTYSFNIK